MSTDGSTDKSVIKQDTTGRGVQGTHHCKLEHESTRVRIPGMGNRPTVGETEPPKKELKPFVSPVWDIPALGPSLEKD